MSVAIRRDQPMRVAEFVQWVDTTPPSEIWELIDGEPVPMAPPSERHQTIVANLLRRLGDLADANGCRALPGLALLNDAADTVVPIPDIVVRRGPLLPDGYARDPVLVAEVLSPTTMTTDRGRKSAFFRTLPSLAHFLIVYQDEPRIEVWHRSVADWSYRAVTLGDTIPLPDLGGTLAVDAVFAGLPFDTA